MTILSSLMSNNIADLNDTGILNILSYDTDATLYDGTTNIYTALVAAVADLPTAGGIIFFPSTSAGGTYLLSTDYTLPANCTIWVTPGATIKIGAGITLTGTDTGIIAELTEIFSGTGTITGTFNTYALYSDWFAAGLTNTATVTSGAAYVNKTGDTMTGQLILPTSGLVVGTDQLLITGDIVSINSTTPTAGKLFINGPATSTGNTVCLVDASTGRSNFLKLALTGTTYEAYIGLDNSVFGYFTIARSGSTKYDIVIDEAGQVGLSVATPTCPLDISGSKLRIRTKLTPTGSNYPGNSGDIAWDDNYLYIYTSTGAWKRVAWSATTW